MNIQHLENEIIDQYLFDDSDRPWIIGFSGGKDSTMLLQLVWNALKKVEPYLLKRKVYIVCNDTLVENPRIVKFINKTLDRIKKAANTQDLSMIEVHQTTPKLDDSFWVRLIGLGYPAPNRFVRWCTERLKINPTTKFILFGLSQKRSPYRVANELVKLLNESDNSPLKNWIRILGKANEFYAGYITQSSVVKNLLLLICGNIKQAEEDKRVLALGKKPTEKPTLTSRETIFRDFFINEEDEIIFKAITNFFKAVQETYSNQWNSPESIIKKTVGFTALFKVFMALAKRGRAEKDLTYEFFLRQLSDKTDVSFVDIQLSSKGVNQLYDRFNLN